MYTFKNIYLNKILLSNINLYIKSIKFFYLKFIIILIKLNILFLYSNKKKIIIVIIKYIYTMFL